MKQLALDKSTGTSRTTTHDCFASWQEILEVTPPSYEIIKKIQIKEENMYQHKTQHPSPTYLGIILFFDSITNRGVLFDLTGFGRPFSKSVVSVEFDPSTLTNAAIVRFSTFSRNNNERIQQISPCLPCDLESPDAETLKDILFSAEFHQNLEALSSGKYRTFDKDFAAHNEEERIKKEKKRRMKEKLRSQNPAHRNNQHQNDNL